MTFLYKYINANGINLIENTRLKVTPPSEFNDVFEFQPLYEGQLSRHFIRQHVLSKRNLRKNYETLYNNGRLKMSFKEFKKKWRETPSSYTTATVRTRTMEAIEARRQTAIDRLSREIGVICFSKVNDSLLMWAHYSDSHRGLVAGFNTDHEFFKSLKTFKSVHYSIHRPRLDVNVDDADKVRDQTIQALFTKSSEWQYEHEWRTIYSLQNLIDEPSTHRPHNYYVPLPAEAISCIIFGKRCPADIQQRILTAIKKNRLQHIRVYKAVLHPSEYRLEIKGV